jgi:ADP-heptose:LPS heptosyltransferase
VLGAAAEAGLCEAVARAAGPMAASLAGRTALEQLAGVLSLTRLAIGNDSGGIHLAAALGVPVVAVFGLTDPVRTAPLGHRQRVVTAEGVTGNRNVAARSRAARRALESIPVEAVHRAACDCLDEPPRTGEGPSNA